MFVIDLTYSKPLAEVEKFVDAHRSYIAECIQKGYFLVAGPKEPRTGGIIISQLNDQAQLEAILELDPFKINAIARFDIIKFKPVRHHPTIEKLII